MGMKVLGIERVALQVSNLEAAVTLLSRLLDTTFERHELTTGDRPLRLAFSPLGIELLQEVPSGDFEGLRSFHLRVADLSKVHAAVTAAGGQVLSQFQLGTMAHLVTRIGPFRVVFVAYPGDDALAALRAPTSR